MSNSSYRISRAGKIIGDFDLAQVRQMYEVGVLLPSDHAWTAGMDEWRTVAALFPGMSPPPAPVAVPPPPPAAIPPIASARSKSPDPFLAMAVPIGRSGWAITAGYLGLLSPLLLPAPFAILCGVMAIKDIRRNPQKLGLVRAWFGVIAGAVCLLVPLLVAIIAAARN